MTRNFVNAVSTRLFNPFDPYTSHHPHPISSPTAYFTPFVRRTVSGITPLCPPGRYPLTAGAAGVSSAGAHGTASANCAAGTPGPRRQGPL